ncbi:MAG: M20/M25/M40 family metallo-hydrolase [bacterium]
MNILDLAKKIISIPSYYDGKIDEKALGEFIYQYFTENVKTVKVSKQISPDGRFNVIVQNTDKPELLFSSHMDTIQPPGDTNQMLHPKVEGDRLFGLGAVDMKGGLTAAIKAIEEMQEQLPPFMAVFDFDEEYYFLGIKTFLQEYSAIRPKLAIFTEPTNLKIVNGCRGILEIRVEFTGKTGHGSRPDLGINAIERSVALIEEFKEEVAKLDSQTQIGKTSINFSGIKGGLISNGTIVEQANSVPDYASLLLDIRKANSILTLEKAQQMLEQLAAKYQLKLGKIELNLDLATCFTKKSDLSLVEGAVKAVLGNFAYEPEIDRGGLFEGALVQPVLGCPCISFGPGPKGVEFTAEEYVSIEGIEKTKEVYVEILKN